MEYATESTSKDPVQKVIGKTNPDIIIDISMNINSLDKYKKLNSKHINVKYLYSD